MTEAVRLTAVETVREDGAWLGTVETAIGEVDEVLVVPCSDPAGPPVRGWINRCMHEDQRLYREPIGAIIRDGAVVCPRHGSHFDTCSGDCHDGEAAGTTLVAVDLAVDGGDVYLVDDDLEFLGPGPSEDDDDDMPASTSHIGL